MLQQPCCSMVTAMHPALLSRLAAPKSIFSMCTPSHGTLCTLQYPTSPVQPSKHMHSSAHTDPKLPSLVALCCSPSPTALDTPKHSRRHSAAGTTSLAPHPCSNLAAGTLPATPAAPLPSTAAGACLQASRQHHWRSHTLLRTRPHRHTAPAAPAALPPLLFALRLHLQALQHVCQEAGGHVGEALKGSHHAGGAGRAAGAQGHGQRSDSCAAHTGACQHTTRAARGSCAARPADSCCSV